MRGGCGPRTRWSVTSTRPTTWRTQITANRARPADSPPARRLPHTCGSNAKINGGVTVQNDGDARAVIVVRPSHDGRLWTD